MAATYLAFYEDRFLEYLVTELVPLVLIGNIRFHNIKLINLIYLVSATNISLWSTGHS